MRKRKQVLFVVVMFGMALGVLGIVVLYQGHIRRSVKIVDTPSEWRLEEPLEGEKSDSVLKPSIPYLLMGEQCFSYPEGGNEVYVVPMIHLIHTNVSRYANVSPRPRGGICECQIYLKKLTIKNGEIVPNSYLDGNEMRIKVELSSGKQEEKSAYIKDSIIQKGEEQTSLDNYEDREVYYIQYERTLPLKDLSQEWQSYYTVDATMEASEASGTENVYQGKYKIVFSVGEQTIEREFPFEYQIKDEIE